MVHDSTRHIPQVLDRVLSPIGRLLGAHDAEAPDIDTTVAANGHSSVELAIFAKLTVRSGVEAVVDAQVGYERKG